MTTHVDGALISQSAMPMLESAGLIVTLRLEPELQYAFRHALVQDAAYASLLRREAGQLHRAVAAALERLYPDRADELAAELVRHYEAAGDLERAAEWAYRAGLHAASRSAMPEAGEFYDRAEKWLPERPDTLRRHIEIGLGQARSGFYFRSVDEAVERLTRRQQQAEQLGDTRLLVELYSQLAYTLTLRGETYQASPAMREAVDRSVELGELLGDDPIRGRPLMILGAARLGAGQFSDAAELLARAAPLIESSGDLDWAFEAQSNLVWALSRLGRFDDAEREMTHLFELAERSGSQSAALDCQSVKAIVRSELEQFDEALTIAQQTAEKGEEKRILVCAAFGHLVAGEIRLKRGDYESALRSLTISGRLARTSKAFYIEALGRAALNAAKWRSGRREAALAGWADALAATHADGDRFSEAEVLAWRGASLAAEPESLADAIGDLEASAAILDELGARPLRARALLDLAAAYEAAGRAADAATAMDRAQSLRLELGLAPSPAQ